MAPASMSKLMTLYMLFERLRDGSYLSMIVSGLAKMPGERGGKEWQFNNVYSWPERQS